MNQMKKKTAQTPQLVLEDKCPECGSANLIHDHDSGETVCGTCGLVVQYSILDEGPEWRAYTQDEKEARSRVGMPTIFSVHDKGLSTSIGSDSVDASGRKLPLSTKIRMWRLKRWQARSRAHRSIDRNLAQAMTELDRLVDRLAIPEHVKEKAAVIYRKALDKGLVRGRSISGIAAASLYAACRTVATPRSLREIAEASLVDRKALSRDYRLILRELGMQMPISDPITYLTKIAEKADIPSQMQGHALKILHDAKKQHVQIGKDPTGLAAAALYIASVQLGGELTQKDIANAAGVTEVTVRNRYRTLKKQLSLQFN